MFSGAYHYENMTLKITLKNPATLKHHTESHTENLKQNKVSLKFYVNHTEICLLLLFNNAKCL